MVERPDVSFWYRWKNKNRRIVLNKSNSHYFSDYFSYPTDEGYHGESITFSLCCYDDGWCVDLEHTSGGRDCDGVVEYTTTMWCPVTELENGNPLPKKWLEKENMWEFHEDKFAPAWRKGKVRVYDQYAQMMGY